MKHRKRAARRARQPRGAGARRAHRLVRLMQLYARKQCVLFCALFFDGLTRLVDIHGRARFCRGRHLSRHGPGVASSPMSSQMPIATGETSNQLQVKAILDEPHECGGLDFPFLVRYSLRAALASFLLVYALHDPKLLSHVNPIVLHDIAQTHRTVCSLINCGIFTVRSTLASRGGLGLLPVGLGCDGQR